MIKQFGENLWFVDGDVIRFVGIPFPTRMGVVRLGSGDLWLHSPVSPTPERIAAVESLGRVKHLVAPNRVHSLGIKPWQQRYPDAVTWVSPRFTAAHPDFAVNAVLGDEAPPAWAGEIDQHVFKGSPYFDEVVFCHRPSRTLIVTDLIQRHDPEQNSWFWRAVKRAAGILGNQGGMARDLRLVFTHRKAARASAAHVLAWDFERVVLSHGACIAEAGHDYVERALEKWLG